MHDESQRPRLSLYKRGEAGRAGKGDEEALQVRMQIRYGVQYPVVRLCRDARTHASSVVRPRRPEPSK